MPGYPRASKTADAYHCLFPPARHIQPSGNKERDESDSQIAARGDCAVRVGQSDDQSVFHTVPFHTGEEGYPGPEIEHGLALQQETEHDGETRKDGKSHFDIKAS